MATPGRAIGPNGSSFRDAHPSPVPPSRLNTHPDDARSLAVQEIGMDDPLAILERAERRARERRLTALAEADRIAAEAAERVAAIEAALPARIEARLAELRAAHARATAEEVAAIEGAAEAATAGAREPRPVSEARIAEAARILVRAVLGEDDSCS